MDYELIDLSTAVEIISQQKDIKYRDSVRASGNKVRFDIEFTSKGLAEEFSFAWATSIREFYDGDFILFLHYFDDMRLIPLPKIYKPGPAPKRAKVRGFQRPEKRLPFI